jgi:ABC-type uncharacterized transport system involved in gliding motility auxiliary subunit
MDKRTTTIVGISVGLILFFAVNILANSLLRSARLDLTTEKLFTLSAGSRNIAQEIKEPIRLKFYLSRGGIEELPQLKTYAQRVEEMLAEYELNSDGKLVLEIIDPEPYSEAESEAVEAGLYPLPLGTGLDKAYFGLVATNTVGDKELISFFDPSQERFLEYEVSRLIYALDHPERKVVGVLSSLDLGGAAFNPMMPRQQGPERWQILDYIDTLFKTSMLEDGITEIPADVNVLLLVHPKGLSEATRYAIDQYVLRGGKAIVCVDAWCDADTSGQDPSNPFGGMGADKTSELDDLLGAWGVELVKGRVAADRENALKVVANNRGAQEEWDMVVWLGLREDSFDKNDAITSRLGQVNLATAGILRQTPGSTTTFQKLIQTSEQSMDVDLGAVQFQANPKDLLANFVPRMERYTLAARVTGPAKTAFPGGRPTPPADGDPAAQPPPTAEHVAEGNVHVIVVSDADFLHERYWLQNSFLLGFRKTADNGDLVINAIENLAGGEDLIAIRGRGEFARPFDRVEEIRRNAEQRYLSEEHLLEQKLKTAEDHINELLQQEQPGNNVILTPEIEAEVDKAREQMAETNRELRDVHYNLSKDIKRLGSRLMWLNVGLLPVLITATAIGLGIAGKRRRQQG